MRLGVMGGTFDPIHHGHLVAASEVASEFQLDEVVFVPTGQPWQKAERDVTAPEHRYLLTVIATAANPRFTVSRVDIDRAGPTYTIDTLRDFRRLYPEAELFFITGADAMAQIMSWKGVDELWELAHFVSVTRPGYDSQDFGRTEEISLMEIPAMAISSTDCRERVRGNKPVWYLVPDGVVQYIAKHRLYQDLSAAREASDPTGEAVRLEAEPPHSMDETPRSRTAQSPQEATR
ncbi:nicotinate-nucleotide adenylyltransferase [Nesterenkonia xinjiangensis]|nr:nicotinate-nucleotide adenylyltransferase [Nesterenkonia xinjiangensis]